MNSFASRRSWFGPAALAVFSVALLGACALGEPPGLPDASRRDVSNDVSCPTGLRACSGSCVSLMSDIDNCGVCGNGCVAGDVCVAGACGSSTMCPAGQISCSGACVSLDADPTHCGTCATVCAAGQTCASGTCRASMTCPTGETDCGGCVDTATSTTNCGMCGRACNAGDSCMGGTCVPATCPAGQTRCGSACVDTSSDRANCGACGTSCTGSQSCVGGACQASCSAPRMTCSTGGVTTCVDPQTDASNCGTCGNVCPGGRVCTSGSCACATGTSACGGNCVNTSTDGANCGSCGHTCAADRTCASGACACNAPLTDCGGTCTLTAVDSNNCGGCGTRCTVGQTCSSGACVMSPCPAGQLNCSGTCVDPATSNAHCGTCTTVCGTGTHCTASACRPDNDARADAVPISLTTAELVVAGTTTGATHDGPTVTCGCTSGGNVWYTFTLTRREAVYFDTTGSSYDTSLFLTDSMGVALPGRAAAGSPGDGFCNDDSGCGIAGNFTSGLQSRTSGLLQAGTYYLAVGGCGAGNFSLHVQHLPSSLGSFFYDTPLTGMSMTSTSLVGTSASSGACGGTASGEDVRWFMTCGGQMEFFSLCQSDGGTFLRHSGTTNFDPSMYIRSGQTGLEVVCNDDGGSMGGTNCVGTGTGADTAAYGSRLNNVVVPRGINAVLVDERIGGSGMSYTLVYTVR